jgi:hypothetical protein
MVGKMYGSQSTPNSLYTLICFQYINLLLLYLQETWFMRTGKRFRESESLPDESDFGV